MSYRSSIAVVLFAGAASLSLSGCDSVNRALGKEKVIPDEFAVVSHAPLAIPPDFSLRPPRVGAGRDQEISPTEEARQSVFRAGDQTGTSLPANSANLSPGEDQLLRQAGAANTPKDIRQIVNQDPTEGQPLQRSFVDKLLFWQAPTTPPSNTVLNPTVENDRLHGTEMAGQPPAPGTPAGPAPTIERTKSTSWFSWF